MAHFRSLNRRESYESQATDDANDVFYDAQETVGVTTERAQHTDVPPKAETPDSYSPTKSGQNIAGPSTSEAAPAHCVPKPSSLTDKWSFMVNQPDIREQRETPGITSASQSDAGVIKACEACEEHSNGVWFCNVCTLNFCDQCWDMQVVHRRVSRGVPHEKTSPDIAAKVHNVLSPPQDHNILETLYREDAPTAWFGVERPDDSSAPLFQDYGRFGELMAMTDPIRKDPTMETWAEIGRDRRTPSLVSFVGQTGAGKSTLIKLLIDFAAVDQKSYSSPVVGPRGAHVPTSEDVHLYVDPKTADSAGPLLYSDCEGLEGGEREPLAAKFKRMRRTDNTDSDVEPKLSEAKVISERELQWANEPRARSREFAVTNLYPRLLYTFSDVIVFVLRNPRVIEHVFERLVKWAAAAIETSSNQPVLPHAIIVLNASEHDLDDRRWEVPYSTESILYDLQSTINWNETFKKWAQFWRVRGKTIDKLLDLILCYYSSIQIIRLPDEGRPKVMETQITKLYVGTLSACVAARHARYKARMLLDVEDLNNYLQEAFIHYSNTLDSPFDFVQASFRNSPIPPDFGGNILKLALDMMTILKPDRRLEARRIFSELSYMVASCIMLDSARNNNKGSSSQIFPKYIHHLDDALENFCDQHWPCEFVNSKTGARCVNVRSGHTSKGHQSADGKVFATGEWVSSFSFVDHGPIFRNKVYHCLTELHEELTTRMQDDSAASEEQTAADVHKSMVLTTLFSHAKHSDANSKGHAYLISHTAYFCCLFGQAENYLPCGHVLCNACINTYGSSGCINGLEIAGCPFGDIPEKRELPWLIHVKPKSAGIRVITLDGGGIRGIIELEVLRQIELALGGVPIQFFVDLIVGTSTGGIIALGLVSMGWRVDECIGYFESLCHEAFTRRIGSSVPLIGSFVENYHHSKYRTSTLERSLKAAFTDHIHLFGGPRPAGPIEYSLKVAVTATSLAGSRTYLLSNYNHHRGIQRPNYYHFQRPELATAELKVWEAARATSAAPRYFKSFHHKLSQKTYIDGAVFHNNPVRIADSERKILWPDCQIPDLFLSIGTGSSRTLERMASEKMQAARKGIVSHGRYLYNIMRSNLQQTLDCERAWDDYLSSGVDSLMSSISASRFIRINPNIGEIPALDEKNKMSSLREKAQAKLMLDQRVKDVARQLIASTFYFEVISTSEPHEENGSINVQGKIRCRLLQPSAEMQEFSKHIRDRTSGGENLKFVVFQDGDDEPLAIAHLTPKMAGMMIQDRVCNIRQLSFSIKNISLPTHIHLYFGSISMHSISGYPKLITQNGAVPIPGLTKPNVVSDSMPYRYAHGPRRHRNLSEDWKPPALDSIGSLSNLHQFARKPDLAIGHDALPDNAQPTTSALETTHPSMSRKRNPIRDTFKALLEPFLSQKDTQNHSNSTDTKMLSPDRAPSSWSTASSAFSPHHYNVSSNEYAIYEQWIGLLQPSVAGAKSYWQIRPEPEPDASTQSSEEGICHELAATVPISELPGVSPPAELADASIPAELNQIRSYFDLDPMF